MASLQRLEIKVDNGIFDADVWETFVKTSLPKLTHFNLESNALYIKQADICTALESFQTPFWIGTKNFNIIITAQTFFESSIHFLEEMQNFDQFTQNNPIHLCGIGPRREFNGNFSSMNRMTSLKLSTESSALLQYHYFDNINHLVLHNMNDELFEWIKTHIKCSRIKHLDVSHLDKEPNTISLLLSSIRNIISLRIKLEQLLNYQHASLGTVNCLKFLDISAIPHSFIRQDIVMITKLFPNIEHLTINTQDLRNIPMLHTYLPRLHSLTFYSMISQYPSFEKSYQQQLADHNLRQNTTCLFQREGNYLTVWIDQATFEEPDLQIFNSGQNDGWFD
jgi:hypothetical protein